MSATEITTGVDHLAEAVRRENRATQAWGDSSHDPNWRKNYLSDSAVPIAPACTCSDKPCPHHHSLAEQQRAVWEWHRDSMHKILPNSQGKAAVEADYPVAVSTPMLITEPPPDRCYVHPKNTTEWWSRLDGGQVCNLCHPNQVAQLERKGLC